MYIVMEKCNRSLFKLIIFFKKFILIQLYHFGCILNIIIFRDCIKNLGITMLKNAYDILEEFENEELEVMSI